MTTFHLLFFFFLLSSLSLSSSQFPPLLPSPSFPPPSPSLPPPSPLPSLPPPSPTPSQPPPSPPPSLPPPSPSPSKPPPSLPPPSPLPSKPPPSLPPPSPSPSKPPPSPPPPSPSPSKPPPSLPPPSPSPSKPPPSLPPPSPPPSLPPPSSSPSQPPLSPPPSPPPSPSLPPPSLPPSPSPSQLPSLPPSPSPSPSSPPTPPPILQESFEVTRPVITLPLPPPECTLSLLNFTFYGQPTETVIYSPPSDCLPPWSHAVAVITGTITGASQPDRVAGVRLDGAEILRTSTPKSFGNGTFWNVSKDITRYTSLLQRSNVPLSLTFENLSGVDNNRFNGIFNINLTIYFYKTEPISVLKLGRKLGFGLGVEKLEGEGVYDKPADLIIPIADRSDSWFRIENGLSSGSSRITIPMNANKVVVELYASSHGDDEFWFSNLPDSYILANNLTTTRGNGAFREVFVKVDGTVVGSDVPFPVVFSGGINPLLWEPVVGIGAFNVPSYDFDLTPFLGLLLDGKSHTFDLGVTNAIKYWLVNANLHVWLDAGSSVVLADAGHSKPTSFEEEFEYEFKELNGKFEVEVERKSYSLGWVYSSCGNFTTSIEKELKFKNKMKFKDNGMYKIVKQKVKVKTQIKVLSETGSTISKSTSKKSYPLTFIISTSPGLENNTNTITTNLSRTLSEEYSNGQLSTSINNVQDAGSVVVLKDDIFVSGEADTQQNLSYETNSDSFTRSVTASGGKVVSDVSTSPSNSIFKRLLKLFFFSW